MSVVKRENRIFGITCPYMTCCKITRRQKKHRAETKRTGAVEHVRLLQLSAAGEVFLEGTCPLSRCPQTAKYSVPLLLGARSRWVRKATAFRGRSEQDRSALVSRLLCFDFENVPVERFQRILPLLKSADTARRVPTMCTEHLANCAQLDQPFRGQFPENSLFLHDVFCVLLFRPSCQFSQNML